MPRVQHRTVPHLDVPHALGGRVLRELVQYALERVGGLHHRERDVEACEIVLEILRVANDHEFAQGIDVVRRHGHTMLAAELEECRRAYRAVEVAMQLGFWKSPKNGRIRMWRHSSDQSLG